MAQQILQVNFNFDIPVSEFEKAASSVAEQFAALPGLLWKIWLVNKEKKEAGGIYLFHSEQAVADYLKSPLFANGPANPMFSNIIVKQFSTLEAPGLVTGAPTAVVIAGQ
jgi:hypothetical protein